MLKIRKAIIASSMANPWNIGNYIKMGLEKNGVAVSVFDAMTAGRSQTALIHAVERASPDILIYVKDYGLETEWLRQVKEKGVPLIQWYIDPVIPEQLYPYVRMSDVFFTMAEGLIEEFRCIGARNIFWLSEAFEPSLHEIATITPEDEKAFTAEVVFLGNLGSKPQYLPRRRYLQRIIDEGFLLKWWGPRLPKKISTIPLLLGTLGRSYGGRFIWGEEHAKVARLSKIYLGLDSQPHISKSMSARLYLAVGCGAFYMCEHIDGIEDVLVPDREIVTFRSEDEMVDKIRFYLRRDDLRKKIAGAGQKRVLREHTYEVRIKEMLTIIEKVL